MMRRYLAPLARQVRNMLARGTVTLSDATGKMQRLQLALLADESKDNVEHFEPFGLAANPVPGAEVLAAFIEGDRSHGIAVAVTDRRYRVQNLASGEVAIYNSTGMVVKLGASGISINGGGQPISIVNAATVTVVSGDILADLISLKNHHHLDSTGHPTGGALA